MATLKTGRLAGIRLLLNRVGRAIDTIRDNERIRFELLSIVTGVWDYIKNSGQVQGTSQIAHDRGFGTGFRPTRHS